MQATALGGNSDVKRAAGTARGGGRESAVSRNRARGCDPRATMNRGLTPWAPLDLFFAPGAFRMRRPLRTPPPAAESRSLRVYTTAKYRGIISRGHPRKTCFSLHNRLPIFCFLTRPSVIYDLWSPSPRSLSLPLPLAARASTFFRRPLFRGFRAKL